jgi:hypothetical protein
MPDAPAGDPSAEVLLGGNNLAFGEGHRDRRLLVGARTLVNAGSVATYSCTKNEVANRRPSGNARQ